MLSAEELALGQDREIWKSKFPLGHVVEACQFDINTLGVLIRHTERARIGFETGSWNNKKIGHVAVQFLQASTRTFNTSVGAVGALGGFPIATQGAAEQSSFKKGESVRDNIRTLMSFTKAIMMRHPDDYWYREAIAVSSVPIINLGSGKAEHPTQAGLDLVTLMRALGDLKGHTLAFIGDLRFGRTVRSLAQLLSFYDVKMIFVSPKILRIPEGLRNQLIAAGAEFEETEDLRAALKRSSAYYVTRLQTEWLPPEEKATLEELYPHFTIPLDVYEIGPKHMIGMHPFPRGGELPEELDNHPNSKWFEMPLTGQHVRAACLELALN